MGTWTWTRGGEEIRALGFEQRKEQCWGKLNNRWKSTWGAGKSKTIGTGRRIYVDLSEEKRRAGAKGSHTGIKGESGRQTGEGFEGLLTPLEGRSPDMSSQNAWSHSGNHMRAYKSTHDMKYLTLTRHQILTQPRENSAPLNTKTRGKNMCVYPNIFHCSCIACEDWDKIKQVAQRSTALSRLEVQISKEMLGKQISARKLGSPAAQRA